jgi:hypothetical protein
LNGAFSSTAATDCSVSHGLPLPVWLTFRVPGSLPQGTKMVLLRRLPGAAGAPNQVVWCAAPAASVAFTRSTFFQSTLPAASASEARVTPATGVASNFCENFSSASPPHRLAVVVCQAPRCWRAMKPLARRGRSSFQAGSSSTASISRAVLTSPLTISHHQ